MGSLPDPATRLAPRLSVLPACAIESRGKQAGPATSSSRSGGRLAPSLLSPVALAATLEYAIPHQALENGSILFNVTVLAQFIRRRMTGLSTEIKLGMLWNEAIVV